MTLSEYMAKHSDEFWDAWVDAMETEVVLRIMEDLKVESDSASNERKLKPDGKGTVSFSASLQDFSAHFVPSRKLVKPSI